MSTDPTVSWSAEDDAVIEEICSRYERLAKAGEFPDLAELLASGPEQRQDELLQQLICLDYEYRRRDGQSVTKQNYLNQFSEHPLSIERAFRLIRDRSVTLAAGPEQRNQAASQQPEKPDADSHQPPKDKKTAGAYQLERFLGSGAFSDVYLGRNRSLRQVAIKILHDKIPDDSGMRDSFTREAETLKTIQHPATVKLLEEFIDETGQPCLVMEYMPGGSLADYSGPSWSHRRIAGCIAELAEALHQMHQQGYYHRDVKPANILMDSDNNPKLADVGLALSDATYGKGPRGTVAGSLAYLSPEQAGGDSHLVNGRTDIYSLGIVLYELLTGKRPFEAEDTKEQLRRIREVDMRPPRQLNGEIPEELERICLKATAKDPTHRYTTALDFAKDLRRFADAPKKRIQLMLTVGALFLLLVAGGWYTWSQPESPEQANTGTAETAKPVTGAETYDRSSLDILVSRSGDHEFQPLEDFAQLLKDDHIHFSVRLKEPAYVRLLWIDATGEVQELYPNDPENGFQGDQPITGFDSPMELDGGWPLTPSGDSDLALLFVSNQPFENFELPELVPGQYPVETTGVTHHLINQAGKVAAVGPPLHSKRLGGQSRALTLVSQQVNSPLHSLLEKLRQQADVVHAVRIPTTTKTWTPESSHGELE